MEILDLRVEENDKIKGLTVFLKTSEGEIIKVSFRKKVARRLMRAIYLQIGIDPRYNSGMEHVVESLRKMKGE